MLWSRNDRVSPSDNLKWINRPRPYCLNLNFTDILSQIILCCGGCSVHHRKLKGISGLCPLNRLPVAPLPTSQSWKPKMFPNTVPRGANRLPLDENHSFQTFNHRKYQGQGKKAKWHHKDGISKIKSVGTSIGKHSLILKTFNNLQKKKKKGEETTN